MWHDLWQSGFTADLRLYRRLANEAGGPILELGAGTGRVALDLAAAGHDVTALDADVELLRELDARAEHRGLSVQTVAADAACFDLARRFALILAPAAFVQIIGARGARAAMLECCAAHLDGRLVLDVMDFDDLGPTAEWSLQRDGVVHAMAVRDVGFAPGGIAIRWSRRTYRRGQARTTSREHSPLTISYARLTADMLADEAIAAGLRVTSRRELDDADEWAGGGVYVLERCTSPAQAG